MSLRSVLILIPVLVAAVACKSTDRDPVIVAPDAPDVSRNDGTQSPAAGAGEPGLLDPNRVVARVNDQVITVRTLNARYGANIRRLGEAGEAQIRQMLDTITVDFIKQVLVLEAAKRLGVGVSRPELEAEVAKYEKKLAERDTTLEDDLEARGLPRWEWEAQVKRELITNKLRSMFLGRASPISPETRAIVDVWVRPVELKEFYERNREDFRVPEEAKVEAIYIRFARFEESGRGGIGIRDLAQEAADETVQKARAGDDFLALMAEYHEPLSTYAKPFGRGVQREPVEEFVWDEETAAGQISDPIELAGGFLILKLERRQAEGYGSFEEVRDAIERFLQNAKINLAQFRLQLALLRESVVTPRMYKVALENQYRQYIRAQIEVLGK